MDDIELRSSLEHTFKHQDLVSHLVDAFFVETQRATTCPDQPRLGLRIPACKEGYLVALADQLFGEVRHHPFSSSVIFRRNALVKRGDLSDSHTNPKLSLKQSDRKFPTQPCQVKATATL